jgi:hypothetical protein
LSMVWWVGIWVCLRMAFMIFFFSCFVRTRHSVSNSPLKFNYISSNKKSGCIRTKMYTMIQVFIFTFCRYFARVLIMINQAASIYRPGNTARDCIPWLRNQISTRNKSVEAQLNV